MRVRAAAATGVALAVAVLTAPAATAITGGEESPNAYPFTGSLQRPESPRPDGHVCGVTLISPEWVVTAAHCARTDDQATTGHPVDWRVRLGSVDPASGGELIDVDEFIAHPSGQQGNDIALLRLRTPAKGAPIPIAARTPPAGTPTRIMGWGVTCDENAPECFPAHLREADTEVQPADACERSGIGADEICVGARDGSTAATNMDSGGPALVEDGDGWALAGAVHGSNGKGQPVVYTDVAAMRSWIESMTADRNPTLEGAAVVGDCSASIVRTGATRPQDPALVLTNGHCTSGARPAPGDVVVERPEEQMVGVLGTDGPVTTAKTTDLVYATMTGTDVALYRLDKTYAQLADEGVKVFELSARAPRQADAIDVVSGGLQDTWSCAVAGIVPELREEGYSQRQAIRYTEDCLPDAGGSGSPLLDPATGAVVGIHNSSNTSGEVCTADNPCEVDEEGVVTVHPQRRYAQQTAAIPACLTPGSGIDLSRPDCALPGAA
ncbi:MULTISPECIES: trypsin-like serine protease [unclassified Saccharopolyspora]|uniref:trypsin-like serine protease n=1 Tax=unclassified Saccharopolyspora TaxID=2646250 RepID=UPI001CD580A8|nr:MULTISPECIES: trypsin-like serine protease [unclassified Saccharopolyspora]MCA1194396.1 trypsin-like serine protease [Saccharopolyspora sp. 6V]MCA1229232.1 trypsin-like serine protease [Saccharopolyspora sp. 6M]MCA1281070.1 trypsin-like serine protease [Saccharopolyspora sp. 7B]